MSAPRTRSASRRNLTGQGTTDQVSRERADDADAAAAQLPGPGVLLTGYTWQAGDTKVIRHPLGRLPRGWFTSRARGGIYLQEVARSDSTLSLSSATAGQADLWVF